MMSGEDAPQAVRPLVEMERRHAFFIGIDSDGCVFDTMELKHKECFIPAIINHFNLQAISRFARQTAEFVNLYSKWRGVNRFPALTKTVDLLMERPEVHERGVTLPDLPATRAWIERETKLSNNTLAAAVKNASADQRDELQRLLDWSEEVNRTIAGMVRGVTPFASVQGSLTAAAQQADIAVVSATPHEALVREWDEHDLARHVRVIAGQEMGSKKEHLHYATAGKYAADHVLMIGDAPGDMRAAFDNDALFFPINPGEEEASWRRFLDEGLQRFLSGQYRGAYQDARIAEFESLLPARPPWATTNGRQG